MARIALEHVDKTYPNGYVAARDLSLEAADGELLVLVGPSGSGKSTVLRLMAGLERVTDGVIRIGERDVTDLPPQQRDIAMVFQNYALYPHMTVRENLGFGMKLRHLPRKQIRDKVDEVAKIVGLDTLLERKPAQLSGGQRQRVAIGRAMVREPDAYLMDEPLSNLDAKLRVAMRAELSKLRERLGVTTVYVTHDQIEAMTLGDRVAVLRDGRLQQVDTPQNLYRRPVNLFVAAFIGSPSINLVDAHVSGCEARFGGVSIGVPRALADSGEVVLGIRPSDFQLASSGDTSAARLRVTVDVVENLGPQQNLFFRLNAPRVSVDVVRSANDGEETQLLVDDRATWVAVVDDHAAVSPGDVVDLDLRLDRLLAFDPLSGESLSSPATAASG